MRTVGSSWDQPVSLSANAVAATAICADQPTAFVGARCHWIATVDWLLAVAAMTHSPAFAATLCRTIEKGIPTGFSAAMKADLPKVSAEAYIARIALVPRPEHIDLRRVAPGARGGERTKHIKNRRLGKTGFATAGAYRLGLVAVVERYTAVGAEFHVFLWSGSGWLFDFNNGGEPSLAQPTLRRNSPHGALAVPVPFS